MFSSLLIDQIINIDQTGKAYPIAEEIFITVNFDSIAKINLTLLIRQNFNIRKILKS